MEPATSAILSASLVTISCLRWPSCCLPPAVVSESQSHGFVRLVLCSSQLPESQNGKWEELGACSQSWSFLSVSGITVLESQISILVVHFPSFDVRAVEYQIRRLLLNFFFHPILPCCPPCGIIQTGRITLVFVFSCSYLKWTFFLVKAQE